MIEEDLYAALADGVPLVNRRVYPLTMPQDTQRDCVVYTVLNGFDMDCVVGDTYATDIRVQVDVFAKKYLDSLAIKDQVRTAMKDAFVVSGFIYVNIYEPLTLKYRQACSMSIMI